jgi:hypothetical protein
MGREEGEGMSSTNPDRSSEEIRRDIERTRAQMDETVEELRERLSPGQLVDEVWTSFKRQGRGTGDVIRDHAVPLALMGLGVAWLAVEEATGHSHSRDPHRSTDRTRASFARSSSDRERWGYADSAFDDEHDDDGRGLRDRASDATHKVKDAARSAKETARDAKEWVGDKLDRASDAGHRARDVTHRATDKARRVGQTTRHRAHVVKDRASTLMENAPLVVGAISFGLGFFGGLAVPTTDAEDELMGDRSDALKRKAREKAREVKNESKQIASDAVHAAREEVERHEDDLLGEREPSESSWNEPRPDYSSDIQRTDRPGNPLA